MNKDLNEALEAIRFTQEYAQLPCVDGWSWWDFYKKHRPKDADRLRGEWLDHQRNQDRILGQLFTNPELEVTSKTLLEQDGRKRA